MLYDHLSNLAMGSGSSYRGISEDSATIGVVVVRMPNLFGARSGLSRKTTNFLLSRSTMVFPLAF